MDEQRPKRTVPRSAFKPGNPGGPGRPKRITEESYLRKMFQVVTLDDWEAITRRAVEDAKKGDAAARTWLTNYLIGDKPPREEVVDLTPPETPVLG